VMVRGPLENVEGNEAHPHKDATSNARQIECFMKFS
jgi:hypothetical protein